jgi:hypothetical protein
MMCDTRVSLANVLRQLLARLGVGLNVLDAMLFLGFFTDVLITDVFKLMSQTYVYPEHDHVIDSARAY